MDEQKRYGVAIVLVFAATVIAGSLIPEAEVTGHLGLFIDDGKGSYVTVPSAAQTYPPSRSQQDMPLYAGTEVTGDMILASGDRLCMDMYYQTGGVCGGPCRTEQGLVGTCEFQEITKECACERVKEQVDVSEHSRAFFDRVFAMNR